MHQNEWSSSSCRMCPPRIVLVKSPVEVVRIARIVLPILETSQYVHPEHSSPLPLLPAEGGCGTAPAISSLSISLSVPLCLVHSSGVSLVSLHFLHPIIPLNAPK